MNAKELNESYCDKKNDFHQYIDIIKKNAPLDIFTIINATLIKNPFSSEFPRNFFFNKLKKNNFFLQFTKVSFLFYLKLFFSFFSYVVSYGLFKIFYKKKVKTNEYLLIDIFFLIDNINKNKKFNENYFKGLYPVLDKYNLKYVFLPRLYGVHINPFKLISFFKIINKDKREFLFEYELLSLKDFFSLLLMILQYPFKTLRLLQKEKSDVDILFNNELINDIGSMGFDAFSRYILGKNIAKIHKIGKIYSWSEFQVVERSFNYGIRTNNNDIKLYGCQFFLNYETYFNSYVEDIDCEQKSSFHQVLVNGDYYIQDRELVKYKQGVSLRYENIFSYLAAEKGKGILLLGSYIENDTKYMLDCMTSFKNVLFKKHPAVNINKLGKLEKNISVVSDDIYTLFKDTLLVIGTASGTSVEAVACGKSVIVIASQDNLTANSLVEYGKGKIWDIAFSKDDVKILYNNLLDYRKNNAEEIKEIASWYKDHFFIEPTEKNIIKAFELDKG